MATANGRDSHVIVDSRENDDIVKFRDLFLMFKRQTTNGKLELREKRWRGHLCTCSCKRDS